MNTVEILYQKYQDKLVPLTTVAADYYAVNDAKTINRMALQGKFTGLRPFKMRESREAPWMIDIDNLASVIDEKAKSAAKVRHQCDKSPSKPAF